MKFWFINVENLIVCLEVKVNVCCVKFNFESRYYLAFGFVGKIKMIGFLGIVFFICICIWSFFLFCLLNLFCFFLIDYFVYYYDLRNIKEVVMVFKGYRKVVLYIKFFNIIEIVFA